jgi:LCP family protein required for cell wall assembly
VTTPWEPRDQRQPLPPDLDPRRGRQGPPPRYRDQPPPPPRRDHPAGPPGPPPPPRRPTGGPGGPGGIGGPPYGTPPGRDAKARVLFGTKLVAGLLSVTVLAVSGYTWYLFHHLDTSIPRVNAIGDQTATDNDGRDENILLVGSDDRSTATPAELKELGTEEDPGKNTDTMILLHVPANGQKATAVSFPRDSYVNIPGFGKNKLNSAYADGAYGSGKADPDRGRRLLVQTISELSKVKIDHYVEVDLLGFYRITKAVGGVDVCLNAPAKDHFSGIDLPAGTSRIEGKQALAFVRQRHGLPRGDLDRIARQQYFLAATFRKIKSAGVIANPIKLKRLVDAVGNSLRMDTGLDPLRLARQVRGLADGNLEFKTVPNKGSTTIDGKSVVLLDEAALPAFFSTLSSTPATSAGGGESRATLPRGQVQVAVYNGSGRRGLATQTKTDLKAAGFAVAGAGNADRSDYAHTVVRYAPGSVAAANTVAAAVPGATVEEDDGISGPVQLVIGRDFTGVKGAAGGGSTKATQAPPKTSAPGTSSPNAPARTGSDAGCIN